MNRHIWGKFRVESSNQLIALPGSDNITINTSQRLDICTHFFEMFIVARYCVLLLTISLASRIIPAQDARMPTTIIYRAPPSAT